LRDFATVIAIWRDARLCFFACGVSAHDIDRVASAILPDCFFCERPPDA